MDTAANAIRWEREPKLVNPVLIAAFEGWNDGGVASTSAVERLVKAFDAEPFARLDPEEFYLFSENRPTVRLVEGRTRRVTWQTNTFYHGRMTGTGRDVILFHGSEPNLKWRTYCDNLVAMARRYEVKRLVTLGAYLADVLYTLPVQITGFATEPDIEERYGLRRSNYEGPTGVVGVLSDYCQQQGMDVLSLWAAVPYYISIPNPKAVHSLLSKLVAIFSFEFDLSSLEQDADNFDNEINDVVAKDPNVAAYVRELKKREFLN
jgi:proteasome assembly chaperone (PAC2) family protein